MSPKPLLERALRLAQALADRPSADPTPEAALVELHARLRRDAEARLEALAVLDHADSEDPWDDAIAFARLLYGLDEPVSLRIERDVDEAGKVDWWVTVMLPKGDAWTDGDVRGLGDTRGAAVRSLVNEMGGFLTQERERLRKALEEDGR